jgi:hypothetical protein
MLVKPSASAIRASLGLALIAAFSWGAVPASAAPVARPASVKDLTRSADFVFRGTVQKIGAANLSIVEPDSRTAVVRVDQVLKAGGTLDDFTGREVTVFLNGGVKAGEQRVFFTGVRLLGESLGVAEVGRPFGLAADLGAQVGSARGEILREDVAARLAAADVAVAGRVLSTRATYETPKSGPITEHDPLWWEAVLEVTSVLKGQVTGQTVTFWYPSSADVMWAAVPKPGVGHEGTWLLHRQSPADAASVLAVADPKDLMSPDEAKTAEGMVKP